LEKKITGDTVAVIAVNLFGIVERFDHLRTVAERYNILIVEDSAQYFPASKNQIAWNGDMSILSFGRGKPVSLLGGGMVVCGNEELYGYLTEAGNTTLKRQGKGNIKFEVKARLYNHLLSPRLYWIPNSLPFLHLGETKYKPMSEISPFPPGYLDYLLENMRRYWSTALEPQIALNQVFNSLDSEGVVDLAVECCGEAIPRLLRYPVLTKSKEHRDRLFECFNQFGLGVSKMYQRILPELEGLENICGGQESFPNAKHFADTLLTFPTHRHVTEKNIQQIKRILSKQREADVGSYSI
jgi:dTDP-4-amino-4,6-dideoxygalactose transaminase